MHRPRSTSAIAVSIALSGVALFAIVWLDWWAPERQIAALRAEVAAVATPTALLAPQLRANPRRSSPLARRWSRRTASP